MHIDTFGIAENVWLTEKARPDYRGKLLTYLVELIGLEPTTS
jgi:hypothetical protein